MLGLGMKHLLHALESRRHKLAVPDAELDQLLSEVKDARVSRFLACNSREWRERLLIGVAFVWV